MMKTIFPTIVVCFLSVLSACGNTSTPNETTAQSGSVAITAVTTTGNPGNYTFSVTITSPDTGCEQYADWWEVFADGNLVYRRILTHSHVDEQPFTRSGGPVGILADDAITVRAHMNNSGYGTQVFNGSINQGLTADTLDNELTVDLSTIDPLPTVCAF